MARANKGHVPETIASRCRWIFVEFRRMPTQRTSSKLWMKDCTAILTCTVVHESISRFNIENIYVYIFVYDIKRFEILLQYNEIRVS